MKVIFSHGEKGGTGKSMAAALTVNRGIRDGLTTAVVDGDSGVPDVAGRFDSDERVPTLKLPLNRPDEMSAQDAVSELFKQLATVQADAVVVNLPAAAGETLDPLAQELVAPAASQLGFEISVAFVVGPGQESVNLARQSLETGLLSIADTSVAVKNGHLGTTDQFAWSHSSFSWPGYTAMLPPLLERVAVQVRERPASFSQIASELPVMESLILQRWLDETNAFTSALLGLDLDSGAEPEPAPEPEPAEDEAEEVDEDWDEDEANG